MRKSYAGAPTSIARSSDKEEKKPDQPKKGAFITQGVLKLLACGEKLLQWEAPRLNLIRRLDYHLRCRTTMTASLYNGHNTCHDLPFLPTELFWLILDLLEPRDLVRCRRVSRAWNAALSNTDILLPLFKKHFPWTKEFKGLQTASSGLDNSPGTAASIRHTFDQVVARYDHIHRGTFRSSQRYSLRDDYGHSGELEWFPVQPWEVHGSQYLGEVDRQFGEAMWTYEEGLLVFPPAAHELFVLLDLNSGKTSYVPFLIKGRVVRRVRLQKRVLVVEWAEPKAFHWLNESDGVHRHFASSFDVTPSVEVDGGWKIVPRNEWKIMFLGHPLSERDRFFSSHTKTHYVIYIWQPNRSLYTADEDAPIESLFVWDISKKSDYRPSLDPTGSQTGPEVDLSPSIVARFGYQELEFFDARQRGFPLIQQLEVSEDGQTVYITENARIFGDDEAEVEGSSQTIIVGIPVTGIGPYVRLCPDYILTVYRSNDNFQQMPLFEYGSLYYTWHSIIAQIIDPDSGLIFRLHFKDNEAAGDQDQVYLTIQTRQKLITQKALPFGGRAKICGCDKYLIGETRNRELVIYRFDQLRSSDKSRS